MAIATASGEILIAVGTAGMTTALKGGGTLVRTASGALTVFDAAGNAVGVIKGTYDATQNGVNLSNGAQVAGGALGLSGSAAPLKGLAAPKPPTHVRPEGRNVSAPATTVPTKQATAAGVGANVDVDDFVAQLPRKRTPTKTQANQYEIRHTGAYNYEISGNGAEFYMDGYRGNTILEAKCVEKPLESPYVPGSSCYERVRERVLNDVRDELRRIRIIIDSKSTPFERIEFITNSPEAKKLFEQLLREFQLPGEVQIRS